MQRDRWLHLVKDSSNQLEDLLLIGEKRDRASIAPLAWQRYNWTRTLYLQLVVLKDFHGQQFSIVTSLMSEIRKLGSSEPIVFADFLSLWGFSTFDNSSTFWRLFDRLATTITIINPIMLNHNWGRTSWWVCWWACPEHRGKWRGDLLPWDRTSIEVG